MRTDIDPAALGATAFYRVMTATVVPRPIAWVCTRSAAGVNNIAPYSFFTVSCVDPPMVQFTSVGVKDSLRNVRDTGEFVVCVATEPLFAQANATGTDFPPDVDEFAMVGLTAEPSSVVAPPRIAESPVAFECRLHSAIELGDSTVVIGRVVHAAIDAATFDRDVTDGGLPAVEALRPLARLGRNQWATVGDVLDTTRIRWADWPGHYQVPPDASDPPLTPSPLTPSPLTLSPPTARPSSRP